MNPDEDTNNNSNAQMDMLNSEQLTTKLRSLEEELDDVREQRRIDLTRPMRGAERDALTRQLDRHETRVSEEIEAIKTLLQN